MDGKHLLSSEGNMLRGNHCQSIVALQLFEEPMDELGPYGRTKREDGLLQLRHLLLVHAAEGGRVMTRREAQVAVLDVVGDATQNSHCLLHIGKALDFASASSGRTASSRIHGSIGSTHG